MRHRHGEHHRKLSSSEVDAKSYQLTAEALAQTSPTLLPLLVFTSQSVRVTSVVPGETPKISASVQPQAITMSEDCTVFFVFVHTYFLCYNSTVEQVTNE